MKYIKMATVLAGTLLAAACANDSARVSGNISAPEGAQIALVANGSALDTLKLGASGSFSGTVKVAQGDPQFVDVLYNGKKIAALLLQAGDKVSVKADTLGNWTVEGSEECVKLAKVEKDYAQFLKDVVAISSQAVDEASQKKASQELSAKYVQYYRSCVKYVLENTHSLTSVPVLFQQVSEDFPVFSQQTDAIHFRNLCDSLKTVYPASRYVAALEKEAVKRENVLGWQTKLQSAEALGFLDIVLPDVNGKKVALSSVDSKAILIHFWSATDASHKMLNVEGLKPLYEKYHSRGLEIYSVCVDIDKANWALAVKNQNLPWINVCDGLGADSPVLRTYNITNIPTTLLILDGAVCSDPLSTEEALRRKLDSVL